MLNQSAALALLLFASIPALAEEPIVVPFNADDDNGDGVRDFEGEPFEGDDDAVVVWAAPTAEPAPLGASTDTPEFTRVTVRKSVYVEALRAIGPDWDGRFRVTLRYEGGDERVIPCQVAPLVVRSSVDPVDTVVVREFPDRNDELVQQLTAVCAEAGVALHVVPAGEPYAYNHIWIQDTVEFLEAAASPAPMTVALAGVRNRALDLFTRDRLLGGGLGYVRVGDYREAFGKGEGGASWIDWYGNLEASPPTEAHPAGRVLYGVDRPGDAQLHPEVVAFLAAQGRQPPLALDVGWLLIKHVDEMVGFVPARDGGFLVLVPDPTAALALLREAAEAGHADSPMLGVYEEGVTVGSVLGDSEFVAANERLWRERIEPMAEELLAGIGAGRDRLRGLPVLFHPSGTARTPNVVNALVIPGAEGRPGKFVASDPDGPVIDGVDAFQRATRELLKDAAVEAVFVDDRQYHKWSGNVHCATNATRPLRD